MRIGIVPLDEEIEELLTPLARKAGEAINVPWQAIWAAYSDGKLLGVATARLTPKGYGEIGMITGRSSSKSWIAPMENLIARWMKDEGMKSIRAYGRKGWLRKVPAGWSHIGEEDGLLTFEKVLA